MLVSDKKQLCEREEKQMDLVVQENQNDLIVYRCWDISNLDDWALEI